MAVTTRLLLAILLSPFLLFAANASRDYQGQQGQYGERGTRLTQAQQCRVKRLTGSQSSERIESEGGLTELWDENEEQFQCAGVAPMRIVICRNSVSLPNFHPMTRSSAAEDCAELLTLAVLKLSSRRPSRPAERQGKRGVKAAEATNTRKSTALAKVISWLFQLTLLIGAITTVSKSS